MLAITIRTLRSTAPRRATLLVALLATAITTTIAFAQAPPATEDDAAALWQEVFRSLDALELDDETRDLAESERPGTNGFDPRGQRAALARYDEVMSLAGRAARAGEVRFDLNYEDGIGLLLPHLAPMRRVARLMAADAALARFEGDPDRAIGRMDELARLSTQPKDDGTLIGSLVSMAVGSVAIDSVDDAIATGEITGEAAGTLLGALPEPGDPFGTVDAIATERDLFGGSIRRALEGDGEELGGILGDPDLAREFGAATPGEVDEWMGGLDIAYDAATAAMSEPDPERARAMFNAFESDLQKGVYGDLARHVVPAMSRVREQRDAMNELLRETRGRLEAIARGEDPSRFADAAPLYRRAFVLLRDLRPDEQMAIELVRTSASTDRAARAAVEIDADVLELASASVERESTRSAIDLLARASAIERCTFDGPMWGATDFLLLDSVEGFMRMGARLLLVDGMLAAEAGIDAGTEAADPAERETVRRDSAGSARGVSEPASDPVPVPSPGTSDAAPGEAPIQLPTFAPPPDTPADRFAQVVAMSAHLAGRERLGSSLVAQSILAEVLALDDRLLTVAFANESTAARCVDRLGRHDVTDPMGWRAARARAESAATDAFARRRAREDVPTSFGAWPLERLAVLQTQTGGELIAALPDWEAAPLRSLDDLVDRSRLEALADELDALRRPWASGEPITIAEVARLEAPPIAPFTRASSTAHGRLAALIDAVDAFDDAAVARRSESD